MANSTKKYKRYIKRANSKDSIRTFVYNTDAATLHPNFSFDAVLNMVNNDPVARGAVQQYVDKFMEGNHSILKRDTFMYDHKEEMILQEKYQFRTKVIEKIARAGKLFNNVFIEIVRKSDGTTKDMNVLDSRSIEPITEPNGDPIKYKSMIPHPVTGEYPEWDKKDIVWIKFGDITTGYAPVDLKVLWETLLTKEYVLRYIAWLWKTGQYRVLYNPKGGSNKDIVDFITFAKRHDDNYRVPFIFKGEMETKVLRDIRETQDIIELLKYLDSQILIALRIPPIDAGIPDASGRSNADNQGNNMSTHITSAKKKVEDAINFDLFPKINKGNSLLKFAPNDRFSEGQVFDNIQKMKSINMTDDVVKEYLADRGMFFASKLFNDPVDVTAEASVNNSKEKDLAISRQRSTDGEGNKPQEEVTTREDQLHGDA